MAAVEPRIAILGGSGTVVTEGLAWMLARNGVRVAGVYRSARQLPSAAQALELNLQAVIIDVDGPSACTAVAETRRSRPQLKIVLLCERASAAVLDCAIEQRAEGVVLKSDTAAEMILALRHVLGGRAVLPAGWQRASAEHRQRKRLGGLSEREWQVIELAAGGMSNRQIADRLVISANTVKFHLSSIYAALGVHNRVQATQAIARDAQRPLPAGALEAPR